MINTTSTFNDWLTTRSKALSDSIFVTRMKDASFLFLTKCKLVTKSFQGITFSSLSPGGHLPLEVKKIHRIILINLRKKFPTLKSGNEDYEAPFIHYYNRANCMYIYLMYTPSMERIIERYFRYIKMNAYLVDNQIPLVFDYREDLVNAGQGTCRVLRLKFNNSSGHNGIHHYKLVFFIPQMIKVLSTLHRKATFKHVELPSATSESSPAGTTSDDRVDGIIF